MKNKYTLHRLDVFDNEYNFITDSNIIEDIMLEYNKIVKSHIHISDIKFVIIDNETGKEYIDGNWLN